MNKAINDDMDWCKEEQLHFAAQDGDLNKCKELIEQGFSVNQFNDMAKTPLHYAAEKEQPEVVKLLIASGADVNAHDVSRIGNTPLREVAATCSYEMAKLLIDLGANPTIPGWMQLTALHQA
ncbi:MAG: ankyrin repeat domain-containing protein [Candidatus Omnitrophica bacterium]|nr:ankyrin repeat domain-containing protein [Candidatus Omnitrophota bacterium]